MSILHPQVARRKFPELQAAFSQAAAAHADVWTVQVAEFPFIGLHVLNAQGVACIGMLLNGENHPFRPLSVTVTDPSFTRFVEPVELPGQEAQDGHAALFWSGPAHDRVRLVDRLWFCVPGTAEYHAQYAAAAPWDNVRHLPTAKPVAVVNACIRTIDRRRLEPIAAGARRVGT